MSAKVDDVMSSHVIVAEPHHTVDHVRGLLEHNKIHAVPVVNSEHEPVGVVSSKDLAERDLKGGSHISAVMSENVLAVPRYEDVRIAARVMRNHRVSHLVVTHEKKVVGMLSSFDLLKLVEEHRWVPKNASEPKSKRKSQHAKA
jgi:CBS domain-containing protein